MTGHFRIGSVVVYDRQRWQIMEYGDHTALLRRIEDNTFVFVRPYFMQADA